MHPLRERKRLGKTPSFRRQTNPMSRLDPSLQRPAYCYTGHGRGVPRGLVISDFLLFTRSNASTFDMLTVGSLVPRDVTRMLKLPSFVKTRQPKLQLDSEIRAKESRVCLFRYTRKKGATYCSAPRKSDHVLKSLSPGT